MSYRKGKRLIAGAGYTPYINERTGNWEIGGVDTGYQATQTRVTVNQYNEMLRNNTLDPTRNYFITDSAPVVYVDREIPVSGWLKVSDGRYTNTITISGITREDLVMVDIASSASDEEYVTYRSAMDGAGIQRIRTDTDSVVLVASTPLNINVSVDITITKCILGE